MGAKQRAPIFSVRGCVYKMLKKRIRHLILFDKGCKLNWECENYVCYIFVIVDSFEWTMEWGNYLFWNRHCRRNVWVLL